MDRLKTALKSNACFCYIIVCSDGTFYTGWTTDLERRVKTHNAGRGARYTRTRRPVKLVYHEAQPDQSSAMKRERAIKKMRRVQKQKLIQNKRSLSKKGRARSTMEKVPSKPGRSKPGHVRD